VLVVQSLPFIAAVIIAAIEDTRFNSFAYWRGVGAKAAVLLPQPGVIPQVAGPQVVTSVATSVAAAQVTAAAQVAVQVAAQVIAEPVANIPPEASSIEATP